MPVIVVKAFVMSKYDPNCHFSQVLMDFNWNAYYLARVQEPQGQNILALKGLIFLILLFLASSAQAQLSWAEFALFSFSINSHIQNNTEHLFLNHLTIILSASILFNLMYKFNKRSELTTQVYAPAQA